MQIIIVEAEVENVTAAKLKKAKMTHAGTSSWTERKITMRVLCRVIIQTWKSQTILTITLKKGNTMRLTTHNWNTFTIATRVNVTTLTSVNRFFYKFHSRITTPKNDYSQRKTNRFTFNRTPKTLLWTSCSLVNSSDPAVQYWLTGV